MGDGDLRVQVEKMQGSYDHRGMFMISGAFVDEWALPGFCYNFRNIEQLTMPFGADVGERLLSVRKSCKGREC